MEDRILINGVWYVKEDNNDDDNYEIYPIDTLGSVVENDSFCFKAEKLLDDVYDKQLDIHISDKRTRPWKTDVWDSMSYFKGIIDGNPESKKACVEDIGKEGYVFLRKFLLYLQGKKWI